jgi:hypothetical protein
MGGFERHSPPPLEPPEASEYEPLTNLALNSYLQEFQSLPTTPNTANQHLPPLTLEESNPERAKWTIAVDLTTDLVLQDGTRPQALTEDSLRDLVENSRGRPDVAIAVQVAGSSESNSGSAPEDIELDRYIIRDGQISNFEQTDSRGIQNNHTDLLRFAVDAAPSDQIGLVIQAHGQGAKGLLADTGNQSLAELNDAIAAGLEGSGHERLDLLDLNACSMSSPAVIGSLTTATDFLVASELRERASKNFVGGGAQNLNAIFSELMANPGVTPEELGGIFVERANDGNTPEVLHGDKFPHVGADILANFSTAEYQQFSSALNELGADLSVSLRDENSRRAIEEVIDRTSGLPGDHNLTGRRDLKQFLMGLQDAAQSGTLQHADEISQSLERVFAAEGELTEDVQGSVAGGYDKLGGMYVFLPDRNFRNGESDGQMGLHRLIQITERESKDRVQIANNLQAISNEIVQNLTLPSQNKFRPVFEAIENLKAVTDDAEYQDAIRDINSSVQGLLGTDVERELRDRLLSNERVPHSDQWNAFIQSFAPTA